MAQVIEIGHVEPSQILLSFFTQQECKYRVPLSFDGLTHHSAKQILHGVAVENNGGEQHRAHHEQYHQHTFGHACQLFPLATNVLTTSLRLHPICHPAHHIAHATQRAHARRQLLRNCCAIVLLLLCRCVLLMMLLALVQVDVAVRFQQVDRVALKSALLSGLSGLF